MQSFKEHLIAEATWWQKVSGKQRKRLTDKLSDELDKRQIAVLGRKYRSANDDQDFTKLANDDRYNVLNRRYSNVKYGGQELPLGLGVYPKSKYLTGK